MPRVLKNSSPGMNVGCPQIPRQDSVDPHTEPLRPFQDVVFAGKLKMGIAGNDYSTAEDPKTVDFDKSVRAEKRGFNAAVIR